MTAQTAEKLQYNGNQMSMCSNPLSGYFTFAGINPDFRSNSTALWRGYIGTWEIQGERLYLIKLDGTLKDGKDATLATFFPDFPDRVFAHWFSGRIRLPQGKILKYVHMGYGSIYERDLFLVIEKGVIKDTKMCNNRASDASNVPGGYEIGGMTIFPQVKKDGKDVR